MKMPSPVMDDLIAKMKNLVPGFFEDRDEEWMSYLNREKKIRMRLLRSNFIEAFEAISTEESDLKLALDKYKKDEEKKKQLNKEFKENEKILKARLKNLTIKILPELESHKKEGLRLKKEKYRRENEELNKRRKLNREDNTIDISEDIELVPDDYLPCYIPEPRLPRPATREQSQPEPGLKPEQPPVRPDPNEEEKAYYEDLEPREVDILRQLKPLVIKYDCRDKVIKAIRSYTAHKDAVKALDAVTRMRAIAKSNKS